MYDDIWANTSCNFYLFYFRRQTTATGNVVHGNETDKFDLRAQRDEKSGHAPDERSKFQAISHGHNQQDNH